ncbi:MAG: hypothetical protein R3Y61_01685 [Rikenellaceae bacterium]
MKKVILMAMFAFGATSMVSCENNDTDPNTEDYNLSGEKYTGEMTILSTVQEDIVFYGEESESSIDIMMPKVSFMPGLMPELDMALLSISLVSESPNTYFCDEAQMVGIYDHLPLINDVIQSITNVEVVVSGEIMSVSFDCGISTTAMGDMTVNVSYVGYTDEYVDEPESTTGFTLDNPEGFFITTSSGEVELSDVELSYYKGNEALVVGGFSYSAYLSTTDLPIIGVTSSEENGKTTLTAEGLEVSYIFMEMEASGTVSGLLCEIIGEDSQMVFTISAAMGNSGTASDYPCTYNGAITVYEESYTAE